LATIVLIFNSYIASKYIVFNNFQGKEEYENQLKTYKKIKAFAEFYKPQFIYNTGPVRSPRLVYGATGISISNDLSNIGNKKGFIILGDKLDSLELKNRHYSFLMRYYYDRNYFVYLK